MGALLFKIKDYFCNGLNTIMDDKVRTLIYKIKEHNSQAAFRELYDLYYNRLFRIAYYYLKQDEWAQEVVLDVFLNLWQQREKLDDIKQWDNYCFILIKNASLNFLEKEQRKESISIDELSEKPSLYSSPEQNLLDEELFKIYEQALHELPTKCREIYLAVKEEKQTYSQIAEAYNISNKTVDSQIQKATSRIKEKIKTYFQHKQ